MKYIFAFIVVNTFTVSFLLGQGLGFSPLECNPEKVLQHAEKLGPKETSQAKLIYPTGSNHFYIFDTLSLPFVDDFSRNYFKSYEPWNNSQPVDSVAYLYKTVPFLPQHPFLYMLQPTFTFTALDPFTVDSVANPMYSWIQFNNPEDPFEPTDTLSIWEITSPRIYFDTLIDLLDTIYLIPDGTLTADTTDTIHVFFPLAGDTSKWIDNSTYWNFTMGVNPPTIGVVTFDGTNEYGKAYSPGQVSSYGVCDYLTSKPIDLDVDKADSVYFSFFYQTEGRGYAPGINDSLVVEFRNPVTRQWHWQWSVRGSARDTFKQVMIPVLDTIFLQKGFQFRFKNYGNKSGNLDHWSIDYVRLDTSRTAGDTILEDVAFVEIQTTMLRRYQRMPYTQFKQDNVENKWYNKLANHSTSPKTICYRYNLRDESQVVLNSYPANYTPLPSDTNTIMPLFSNGYATYSRWAEPDFNFSFQNAGLLPLTDSTEYLFTHYIENFSLDTNRENDTIHLYQPFHNYFAYDDGTAEQALWLGFPGQVALQFTNNYPDTLRAIQFYFSPIREDVATRYFDIKVWSDLNSNTELYSENRQIRVLDQETDATQILQNNGFTTYFIDPPIPLPAGDFYIGWKQSQSYKINVGFDVNSDASDYAYFNTGGSWTPFFQEGAPMIRPLVGPAVGKQNIGVEEPEVPTDILMFPNPAQNIVYFQGDAAYKVQQVDILDISGKLVSSISNISAMQFDISGLSNGMYLVRFVGSNGMHQDIQKLIVAH